MAGKRQEQSVKSKMNPRPLLVFGLVGLEV